MGDYVAGLRWFIVATLLVLGLYFMKSADASGSYLFIGPGVLFFGFAYLFGYFWHKYKRKQTLVSFFIFFLGAIFSKYAVQLIYIASGSIVELPWVAWWLLFNAVVGIPVMAKFLD